jgi:iron complex transport system ATP-binding protein
MRENSTKGGVNIELTAVRFERLQRVILRDVSWRVPWGEHWAIVGANGSGKTTLLQIIVGYLWPTQGEVTVLGQRHGQVDLRQLRQRIGWVSSSLQSMIHPSQTALQMVLSGAFGSTALFNTPGRRQTLRARDLLEQVGCDALGQTPFGVLSLGEQQRVLLARALMSRPQLLILDEACAGLDLAGREALLATVEQLAASHKHLSLLQVTHHIEEISPSFSHVLVLREGCILAAGPKGKVLNGAILSKAFGVKVKVTSRNGRYWTRVGD